MKPNQELTEEQKEKMKALSKTVFRNLFKRSFKFAGILLVSNLFIVLVAVSMVPQESIQTFCFLASIVNAFFIFRSLSADIQKEHDRIKEEVKKILQQ